MHNNMATVKELKAELDKRGIKYTSRDRKADLEKKLSKNPLPPTPSRKRKPLPPTPQKARSMPDEALYQILLQLDGNDLDNMCKSSKATRDLCKGSRLWKEKAAMVGITNKEDGLTWKDVYTLGEVQKFLVSLGERYTIKQLKTLDELYLEYKGLTTFPTILARLPKLKELSLNDNRITNIPNDIEGFSKLQGLVLSRNDFKTADSLKNLSKLKTLKYLDLSHSNITKLPDSLNALKNLEELRLEENQLKEIPESLGKLKKLVRVNVESNDLRSLPKWILEGKFEQLQLDGNYHIRLLVR